ncbi:glycoside hydrolase family 140 protein [Parapedobacter koreensis]|uniref:glycoside hydrolase family 140 protein n=1 Tax=Parapedobacter koreensis TaxID=332977 RepID=UPI001C42F9EC|nr:glycoside hydrolase family 140 protein [Parapedobacter koreensis]
MIVSLLLVGMGVSQVTYAQNQIKKERLKVSPNGRFLVYQDGSPFFWLGDTAWELIHRLDSAEVIQYLDNRKAKGFNVIQAVILAELDGLHTPNANGDLPLVEDDPSQPNEAYFGYVDWIVDQAGSRGIYMALLPTWGDKLMKLGWGIGPEIFNEQLAEVYGEYLGRRYRKKWNVIWINGGDRNPSSAAHENVWRSLAMGIVKGAGGYDDALISFHPQPADPGGSSNWFHNDDWLDFNMHQTGHCNDGTPYLKIAYDYGLTPIKPTLDGEPLYEEHPLCGDPEKYGFSGAYQIRKKAYWDVFYGAFGHTYGCHAIWQMYDQGRQPINSPQHNWKESLDLEGAGQMIHLKKLMLSRPFLERIPDQTLVITPNAFDGLHVSATRSKDGSYAMLYFPGKRTVAVNTRLLSGTTLKVWWYNPRTGQCLATETIPRHEEFIATPPSQQPDEDWVLILDDSDMKFKEPGT